jgi:hypothetical protein
MVVLTVNPKPYKEGVITLIAKLVILNGKEKDVNLIEFAKKLSFMGINKLDIFSVNKSNVNSHITISTTPNVNYYESGTERFIEFLQNPNEFFESGFIEINKHALYIFRDSNYIDIKNIFTMIENQNVNIGRGGGQKAHLLSPLELKLNSYLLAMYDFDYKLISSFNMFNDLDKVRYLLYTNKFK